MVPQLGALCRSERPRLLRRVRGLLRNQADAEDLVQDVFVNLLRRDLRAIESPRSYLARAATNAVLDHLRHQRVRARVIQEGLDPDREAAGAGAEAALPPKCRVAFLLSRVHGLTMREIAERMEISEKTVEKHLLKAMLRCRAALAAAGRGM